VLKKKLTLLIVFVTLFWISIEAQNVISGIVTDAETGESVIGCNVSLQGTTLGNVTDLDGKFEIKNVTPGTYNIVFSFISYDKQVEKVVVTKNSDIKLKIVLKPSSTMIQDVVVTATRRTDTELSMLSTTKQGLSIANGITSQQISRSQDKDASEVIRRIPGVSIRDGKFVIVRGLTERYNSVWLNGSSTPSSESDVRAFSFDIIPSGQIDNILIYKTPSPELPADFAGAMINIKSKSLIDRNSISVSYSYGYHQGTTYQPFYTYQGSKTDYLGYDKTVRIIPTDVPATSDYKELFNQVTDDKKTQINNISKSFNTIMTPTQETAKPDADVQLAINSRFRLGNITVGAINALGYNSSNVIESNYRAAYLAYPDTSYRYIQNSFASKVRISALSNWLFTFGNNQKIEFRNLFNNYGMTKTVLKEGYDFYTQSNERSYELGYESRTTYSGQLAGNHTFLNERIKLDWVLGYSYANKNQPDIRRIKTSAYDTQEGTQYMMNFSSQGAADALGRIFLKNEEQIYNAGFNYSQRFKIVNITPEIKAGAYYEKKQRTFSSRIFNYVKSGVSSLYYYPVESYNGTAGFDDAMFSSISDLFTSKIDYQTGLVIKEVTQKADSYDAENQLSAGYLAVNIPFNKWLNVYMGVRAEHNKLTLDGYKRDGTDNNPINVVIDSLDFFPSLNATLKLSEKYMFRLASGKTVNRPEFREVSPFVFYSFEDNATTYGNPTVVNSYITNSDFRFEWYPTPEELVSLGVFYKSFKNPIESKILYTGSGWNYTFENAEKATSYGLEVDIRKTLHEFEKAGFFSFLKDLTIVVNASLINSIIKTDSLIEGASQRTLQGQSPYIINVGTYYQNSKNGIMLSLMYNKTGKRIATVGDINIPHIYEMPFNSLDFSAEKKIGKYVSIKLGMKNLLDDAIVFQQFQKYTDTNGTEKVRNQITNMFRPGRQIKLGLSINL
jgi:TonB-dependent receptor